MFTPAERSALRDTLIDAARRDPRITGVALTGSSAIDAEDRWSDIDLAFGVAASANRGDVIAEWTARMYDAHGAVHHTDMSAAGAQFRVFLLRDTLQVDLAFWPESEFGAIAPTFRLVSGTAKQRPRPSGPAIEPLIGMAWLYALHARSSIARGKLWQAEYMISGARDHVLALSCVRHGVPAVQGRGMDLLPVAVSSAMTEALVRSLDRVELRRALRAACVLLLTEIRLADPELAHRLSATILELAAADEVRAHLE